MAASINGSVCESTGQSPFYIVYGMEKRLPYDLLEGSHKPVYNIEDYAKSQLIKGVLQHSQKCQKPTASL